MHVSEALDRVQNLDLTSEWYDWHVLDLSLDRLRSYRYTLALAIFFNVQAL